MRRSKEIMLGIALGLGVLMGVSESGQKVSAKAVTSVSMQTNINLVQLTALQMNEISRTTPLEKSGSDLYLVHPATRISTARLPQSFAYDGRYYYYVSQLADHGKYKDDLRVTRVQYFPDGQYLSDYMTLVNFGHGTNIDCTVSKGSTWLWTGSDSKKGNSASISCFQYAPGKVLKNHAPRHYKIRIKGSKRHATNCYPAVSDDGKKLAIRFTRKGKQQFQIYRLKGGKVMKKKILKSFRIKNTRGDFQGFDLRGTTIYTVEGSRSIDEMRELGKAGSYRPIKIRTYHYRNKKKTVTTVSGAAALSHREPEGIHIDSSGAVAICIASHYKELYTCMNIYRKR